MAGGTAHSPGGGGLRHAFPALMRRSRGTSLLDSGHSRAQARPLGEAALDEEEEGQN